MRVERIGGAWKINGVYYDPESVVQIAAERDTLRTRLAEVEAENGRLREAVAPFADVGVWLFAIDAPDDTPLVTVRLINNAEGHLTRGMFKEAHLARAALAQTTEKDHD